MKYIGLDIGDKRVGIALSQSGILANPLENYTRVSLNIDCAHILSLVRKYDIDAVVAGRPVHLNGDPHIQAEKNDILCKKLADNGADIIYWDERFSSHSAEQVLIQADMSRAKRKQHIDKLAAVIILQNYLDYINNK